MSLYHTNKNQSKEEIKKKYQEFRKHELEIIKSYPITAFLYKIGWRGKRSRDRMYYQSLAGGGYQLVVYEKRNDWYDFGLQRGGSIIDLVMAIFDKNYIEAVKDLRKMIFKVDK